MSENLNINKHKIITTNKIQILGYRVIVFPVPNRALLVDYATGYDQDGIFVPVSTGFAQVQGEEFDLLVGKNPRAEQSFYANIKRELYDLIDSQG